MSTLRLAIILAITDQTFSTHENTEAQLQFRFMLMERSEKPEFSLLTSCCVVRCQDYVNFPSYLELWIRPKRHDLPCKLSFLPQQMQSNHFNILQGVSLTVALRWHIISYYLQCLSELSRLSCLSFLTKLDNEGSVPLHMFLPLKCLTIYQLLSFKGESAPVWRWLWDSSKLLLIWVFSFFLLERVPMLTKTPDSILTKGKIELSS